jgi:predicted PurR-regulated permease PerM
MKRKTLIIGMTLFLLLVTVLLVKEFSGLFMLFTISVITAYLLHPIITAFIRVNVPVTVAILVTYAMILSGLLFLIIVAIPEIYGECAALFDALPVYYEYVMSLWNHYVAGTKLMSLIGSIGLDERISLLLSSWTESFADRTVAFLSVLPRIIFYSVLVPVVAYYFLRDKEKISDQFLMFFPPSIRVNVMTLWEEIDGVLWGFVKGNLLISLIVGTATAVGLVLLKVDYAVVLGILYGILDIIPYFGPFLGAIPIIVLPLLQGDVNIFFVIILLIVVQQGENIFISPRVLGNSVGLHPVTVIFLVLVGGYLGGILGMVLIIPLFAVLKVVLRFIYQKIVAYPTD